MLLDMLLPKLWGVESASRLESGSSEHDNSGHCPEQSSHEQ
jgi:hypothetical protein